MIDLPLVWIVILVNVLVVLLSILFYFIRDIVQVTVLSNVNKYNYNL